MSPLGCPHYFWFPHLRSGLFGFCQPGHRKKTSNSPFIRPSVSQSVESSIHQPFNHSLVSTVVTHSHSSGGSGRSRAGADGAELRQPRCTIPWCASMKTNWYLPDTWDWLSSIKGAAAVVWVSDWMARMRCLHFEFTCLPRPRCHLDYLYPPPKHLGVGLNWYSITSRVWRFILPLSPRRSKSEGCGFHTRSTRCLTNVSITWQPG